MCYFLYLKECNIHSYKSLSVDYGIWIIFFFAFVWITIYSFHEKKTAIFKYPKGGRGLLDLVLFVSILFPASNFLSHAVSASLWKGFLSLLNGKSKVVPYSLKISVRLKWGKESWVYICFAFYLEHCDLWRGLLSLFYSGLWKRRGWGWAIHYTQVGRKGRGYS